jgi:D-3-phosphoglycerate dehydrogenase / 2-oxoglutarate reductase
MTTNAMPLAYFERWLDPVAEKILSQRPEIELMRLTYADPVAETDDKISTAYGYQISPRTELLGPYFGDAALLAKCWNLLAISSSGAGYDMVDVDACTAAGVLVCNQSGTNARAVAEHALGMMLSLAKYISQSDKIMRRGGNLDRFSMRATDLENKTVGIVGLGHIGGRTAELCKGLMGMTVLAYDPYLSAEQISARGATKVAFDELLTRSDFVSVHCPRAGDTLGMFAIAQFRQMKRSAYFINTARGGIHVEDDLADALEAGLIAGAGVDVFLSEPVKPHHRLLSFENVIASPHIAGMTDGALYSMANAAAEQWITIMAGGVPPRLVNPEAWPKYTARFQKLRGFAPASL